MNSTPTALATSEYTFFHFSTKNRNKVNMPPYAFHQRRAPLTPWGHSLTPLLSIV